MPLKKLPDYINDPIEESNGGNGYRVVVPLPVKTVEPALPDNFWTISLKGAAGDERHKAAFQLSRRYLECGLTLEEVTFILCEFGKRCSPPMRQSEIRNIVLSVPSGKPQMFVETVPWPEAVRVDEVLNDLSFFVRRFVVVPEHAATAIALWIIHAWCLDAFNISPLLRIKSPTKSCGKSTLLNLVAELLPKNASSSNYTPAVMFRLVDAYGVSVAIDEVDINFGNNPEIVGLVNSGYMRKGAVAYRCSGDANEPRAFNSWSAKVLAGIGKLFDTTESRSIQILMRKKKESERVQRIRESHSKDFETLKQKCRRIAFDHVDNLRDCEPEMPPELGDRQADNWRPLLSIADLAGGQWPVWGRQAAVVLSSVGKDDEISMREILLSDLKEYFDRTIKFNADRGNPIQSLPTAWILDGLNAKTESPWPEYHNGGPMTPRQLAGFVRPFGIESKDIWWDDGAGKHSLKGYTVEDFRDVFDRYL